MLEDNEVFIHIGLPKTATTFFQKEVFPRIQNIKLIQTPFTQYNEAFNSIQYADETIYNEDVVKEELAKYKEFKKILISEESFSGATLSINGLNRSQNANRLKKLLPNARIILFLRGQKNILYSMYNQYVRTHNGTRRLGLFFRFPTANSFYFRENFNELTKESFINFLPNHSHLDLFKYYNLIKLYKSLFEKVDVFLYEDFCLNPNDTLISFESIFKEPILNPETINFEKKTNNSVKKEQIERQIFFNKTNFIFRKKNIANLFFFIYRLKFNSSFLEKETEFINKTIKNYFKEDNKKIIQEFKEIKINSFPENYDF
ncbi:MAG: hypothetical protein HXX09_13450 [Bacteroidetes bacterium]|nr:hypothetical protein [Bacteroidota bacterium]